MPLDLGPDGGGLQSNSRFFFFLRTFFLLGVGSLLEKCGNNECKTKKDNFKALHFTVNLLHSLFCYHGAGYRFDCM